MIKLKNEKLAEVKNIVFDLGNVLLDIDISKTVMALAKLGVNKIDPTSVHPNNSGVFLDMEIGAATENDFFETIKNASVNPKAIQNQQIVDAWNAMLLEFDFERFKMLDRLRESGFRVFLLSNTNKLHHDFFEEKFNSLNPFGKSFKNYFDIVFYSNEMKMRKPGEEIYCQVEKIAGLVPSETLFVDDNEPNLRAPHKRGWKVYHLVKPEVVGDIFVEQND